MSIFTERRISYYTDSGDYMGWAKWDFTYLCSDVRNWIGSGNSVKFDGMMFTNSDALFDHIKAQV
jgi:hypothetical protein